MVLIFAKILSVFGISLLGYIANKVKWLPAESAKYLSQIVIYISNPCLIIYSVSQQELNSETLTSVLQSVGLMVLALVVFTVIAFPAVRIMKAPAEDRGVYRALLILSNCGFMGYPLSLAVFGQQGLFLTIIANPCFTFYAYSVGVIVLVSSKKEKLTVKTIIKSVVSIPTVSTVIGLLVFAFGIRLPDLLVNFLDTVGAITIPLSMIIIGIQLAESKVTEVLKNRHIFETAILRLIVFPLILFGLFLCLPVSPFVSCIIVYIMAMPSAAITPMLAEIYGVNEKLAAQAVFITTIFSLITLSIWAIMLTLYLGG